MNDQNRQLFVPGHLTYINADGSQALVSSRGPNLRVGPKTINSGATMNINTAVSAARAGYDLYNNNPQIKQAVQSASSKFVKSYKSGEPRSSSGGALSPAPNPANTKLDTGIKLASYEKDYLVAEENSCSPLHTSHVYWQFPASTGKIYDFFYKVMMFDSQTRMQENVNWSIDITNKFSADKLSAALNDLFYALQVYFFVKSIDSYHRGAFNNNEAMYDLRSQFTFDTIYKLDQLSRLLVRTALPPNMLEFCRYVNSNYVTGELPNSPMIKIVPFAGGTTTAYLSNMNSTLDTVINNLSLTANREIYSVMNRSLKHWVLGDVNKLFDPPIEPAFDRDFLTLFNNLPFRTGIVGATTAPSVAASNTTVKYLSYTNNLDGAVLAFTDVFDSVNSRFFSGMTVIPNTGGITRYSYYAVSGIKGFYSSNSNAFLRNSRMDTYTSDTTTLTTVHRYGTDIVLNINADILAQVSLNVIDWLLSIDKIRNESIRQPSMNYTDNSRRRRGSDKSKDKRSESK